MGRPSGSSILTGRATSGVIYPEIFLARLQIEHFVCCLAGYQFTVKQIDAVPEDAEQYNDCGSELLFEGQFSEGAAATPKCI